MDRGTNKWIWAVVRPPLLVIGFVVRLIYRLLFSRLDRKLAKRNWDRLGQDIQNEAPFLFRELAGQIVPYSAGRFTPPFDYATVTVSASAFNLQFTRGRGDLSVRIAPRFADTSWHELSTVLDLMGLPGVGRGSITNLSRVGILLRQYADEISKALSDDQYCQLKLQLEETYQRDRIITKQLENEINRRLYG